MRRELKIVAIWSAMAFLLGAPLGVYLMSFRGEGLQGNVLYYVGAFVELPGVILYRPLGLPLPVFVLVISPLLYLWFALWVGLLRWWQVRSASAARGNAAPSSRGKEG